MSYLNNRKGSWVYQKQSTSLLAALVDLLKKEVVTESGETKTLAPSRTRLPYRHRTLEDKEEGRDDMNDAEHLLVVKHLDIGDAYLVAVLYDGNKELHLPLLAKKT
jgi:hypothetical protein